MALQRKKEYICGCYRPELDRFPKIDLPVYPRSSGHFRKPADFQEKIPPGKKNFVQIFWGIEGEGLIEINGKNEVLHPGEVVYHLPMEPHIHQSITETWEYRWITFDGPNARNFILSYHYPRTCFPAGPCPHESFLTFENLMLERTPYAWRKMFAVICDILALAGGANQEATLENKLLAESIRICRENFQNPNLNVNALAERLNVNRSTLLRIFRKKMDMAPSEYIGQLRLQNAVTLLKQTLSPIREIADRSGFQDVNYFCRIIKSHTGLTPSELRK